MTKLKTRSHLSTQLEIRADDLPSGVCGRLVGTALVYGVVDSWGTRFARGCLDKTRGENGRVTAGKVRLFEATSGFGGHEYGTANHIGVVRSLTDMGENVVMVADLFDAPEGRAAKEYVAAVLAAGAETGLSIGFMPHGERIVTDLGERLVEYTEIELREITLTANEAVPGALVMGVRSDAEQADAAERTIRLLAPLLTEAQVRAILEPFATPVDTHSAPESPSVVDGDTAATASYDARLAAYRRTFAVR